MFLAKCVSAVNSFLCVYGTNKILLINSRARGIFFRFCQLCLLLTLIGSNVYWKKYQDSEIGTSAVTSKVKGVSFTNSNDRNIWDVADYVVPPLEDDAFFITTNALFTMSQTQRTCSQDAGNTDANCKTNADCRAFETDLLLDGVKTGICSNTGTCEVYAWCPVESSKADAERIKEPLLKNVNNFTVFIKNNIEFKENKLTKSNIPNTVSKEQLASCRYDPVNDPHCPVFSIGTILSLAKTKYEDIAKIGGVISFSIDWDCNLDLDEEKCFPTYSFSRLDVDVSKGYNLRYANYYVLNGVRSRDLIKVYGIRFLVSVSSKAGKFSPITCLLNLGSSLSLFTLVVLFCDFLYFSVCRDHERLSKCKYDHSNGGDDNVVLELHY